MAYAHDPDPIPATPAREEVSPQAIQAALGRLHPDLRHLGELYLASSDPGRRKITMRGLMDPAGGPDLLNSLATMVQAKMTIGSEKADHAMLGAASNILAGKAFTQQAKAGVIPHVKFMSASARLDWVRRLGWMKTGKDAAVVDSLRELQKTIMGCYDADGNLISVLR